jgi:hypothetical protein
MYKINCQRKNLEKTLVFGPLLQQFKKFAKFLLFFVMATKKRPTSTSLTYKKN